jgi:tetratricopeptide (TPR) repeat protein
MSAVSSDSRPSNRWLYATIALLLALSVSVQAVRDRGWAPYEPPNPTLWLNSGPLAAKLALSFRSLAADVYWMRAVVYYGGRRLLSAQKQSVEAQAANFDLLYPLLDLATALDPHFKVAYRFGAIFLTEAYPSGPGRPDLAIGLLERAIERDAARWEYFEDIGFVYYWWLRDYDKAGDWFKRASEQPGAPSWLAPLAATTLAEGGDRPSSRFLWTQLLQNSDVEWVRQNAVTRLQQLDAMDNVDELNRLVGLFTAREHRPPREWRELEREGVRSTPIDPTGVPYRLDPATGKVDIERHSRLWPLPWEPVHISRMPTR